MLKGLLLKTKRTTFENGMYFQLFSGVFLSVFKCVFIRLLFSYVVYEGVALMMLLIGSMLFAHGLFPSLKLGEEGVGIGWSVVYFGKAEAVGAFECLHVDACSTYYIYVLILGAVG